MRNHLLQEMMQEDEGATIRIEERTGTEAPTR